MKKLILFLALSFSLSMAADSKPVIAVMLMDWQVEQLAKGTPQFSSIVQAVEEAGGQVLFISKGHEHKGEYKALIVPGGDDIDPSFYHEKKSPKTEAIHPDFDQFEIGVIQENEKKALPILGICRGFQLIDVVAGGSLYQDLPTELHGPAAVVHRKIEAEKPLPIEHKLVLEKGSNLEKYFGSDHIVVNSYHHQGVKTLGQGLKATAHSEDGLIEAYEGTGPGFLMAVQFHPEKNSSHREDYERIFKELVKKAKETN